MSLKELFRTISVNTDNELRESFDGKKPKGINILIAQKRIHQIKEEYICSNCKESIHTQDKYCSNCGKKLGMIIEKFYKLDDDVEEGLK